MSTRAVIFRVLSSESAAFIVIATAVWTAWAQS